MIAPAQTIDVKERGRQLAPDLAPRETDYQCGQNSKGNIWALSGDFASHMQSTPRSTLKQVNRLQYFPLARCEAMGRRVVRKSGHRFSVRPRAKFGISITLSDQIGTIWSDRDLCGQRPGEGSLHTKCLLSKVPHTQGRALIRPSGTFSHPSDGRRGMKETIGTRRHLTNPPAHRLRGFAGR